jgi:diguanylate cyclase (GGDEF)-like protein/PAS domain S-box-containing protein
VEQQLRSLFENTSAGIFLLDSEGRLQTANPTLARVLGLPKEAEDLMAEQDFAALAFAVPEQFHALMRRADQQGQVAAADLQLHNSLTETAWVHCLLSSYYCEDGKTCFEGVVYDITERRATEMHFRHEADHDPLTGLHRRQVIERDLERLLEQSPKAEGQHVLLLLDLDNFKEINDNHGHAAGDAVLVETAKRLKACVRSDDKVARLGGDEFVIVLVNCVLLERARNIARQLVTDITQPILLGEGQEGRVGVSIGIAIHDEKHSTMYSLLKAADLAMYEVKRQGKNGFGIAKVEGGIWVERIEAGQWV